MISFETDWAAGWFARFDNVWFTSDTHFSHRNIINLSNRPFRLVNQEPDVDGHDQTLIQNINACVGPNDLLIHHGDVALGKIADSLPLVGLLNGYKVLIPGNHDRVFSGEKEKMRTRFDSEYRKVFHEIWPESVRTWIPHLESYVVLSHFPYIGDSQENDRHVDKRPVDYGYPLIHGHIHEKRRISGKMFNVGVDVNDFYPVHHSILRDWIKTL
jgi:calcineurin-like phosphoesterase family protein